MRIDLETRELSANTVATYLRDGDEFVREIGKPIEHVDRDDVGQYLVRLRAQGKTAPTRNTVLAAVRFLFSTTLRRPEVVAGIRRARTQPKVPIILSGSEVARLLASLRSVTYRAMVATLYGAGPRVSEMCALRIEDIDSKRMQLRVAGTEHCDAGGWYYDDVLAPTELRLCPCSCAGMSVERLDLLLDCAPLPP